MYKARQEASCFELLANDADTTKVISTKVSISNDKQFLAFHNDRTKSFLTTHQSRCPNLHTTRDKKRTKSVPD